MAIVGLGPLPSLWTRSGQGCNVDPEPLGSPVVWRGWAGLRPGLNQASGRGHAPCYAPCHVRVAQRREVLAGEDGVLFCLSLLLRYTLKNSVVRNFASAMAAKVIYDLDLWVLSQF